MVTALSKNRRYLQNSYIVYPSVDYYTKFSYVNELGDLKKNNTVGEYEMLGVRPAMWIKLKDI